MRRYALILMAVLSLGLASGTAFSNGTGSAQVNKTVVKKVVAKKAVAKKPVRKAVMKKSARGKKNIKRASARRSMAMVPPVLTMGELAGLHLTKDPLDLRSNVALVVDQNNASVLFEKNAGHALPIASVTKLMTALVVVEAGLDLTEQLSITTEDIDREKNTTSRLRIGSRMSRDDMLHISLMSSENRAASALGRHYPGGLTAFVAAMNEKARKLGMTNTSYVDSTGLSRRNTSTAHDLARLVVAAYKHEIIREYSTNRRYVVDTSRGQLQYGSSNRLISGKSAIEWDIGLQKTGFINEAGHCLVMQTTIDNRPVVMVFLDSKGKLSPVGDANRLRRWLAKDGEQAPAIVAAEADAHVDAAAGQWLDNWNNIDYSRNLKQPVQANSNIAS